MAMSVIQSTVTDFSVTTCNARHDLYVWRWILQFLSRDATHSTYTRQIENQQVPCTEVTISPYLQYTSNLTKDISSLVCCLTMF